MLFSFGGQSKVPELQKEMFTKRIRPLLDFLSHLMVIAEIRLTHMGDKNKLLYPRILGNSRDCGVWMCCFHGDQRGGIWKHAGCV